MKLEVSEDLELRIRSVEDAQEFFELIDNNREYLREHLPWVDGVKEVEDIKKYLQLCLDVFNKKTGVDFGIFYKNKLVGSIGSNHVDKFNKVATIGYWLDEKHNGKGIVTSSLKAFANYLFNEFDINRIEVRVANENVKSWAIPERLGFKFEGVLRQAELLNGKFLDLKLYSLLKSDLV